MKLLWTGSDVLFATRLLGGKKFPTKKSKYIYFFAMTVFAKLADIFIERHYVVSEHLIPEVRPLRLKKKISVLVDPPLYQEPIYKRKHDMFRVLYYRGLGNNQKFLDWVYGYDIIQQLKKLRRDIHIVEVNGNQDMKYIYPYIDFMVRPNRHDGNPRIVMECKTNDIPYYWSKENPDIEEILKAIMIWK